MQIKDSVFVVTGASSGIGLATATALADRGAKAGLLARGTDALEKLARQLPGSLPVTVDMTQFDRVREAIAAVHRHFGRIDGLVNNAGRSYAASIEEIDPARFDEIFHLNVLGPIVAMQAAIPLMRAQGGGSIVTGTSTPATESSTPAAGTDGVNTVNGGYGLTGMRERLRLLNGTLQAGRRDNQWIVTAELPRSQPGNPAP